MRKQGRKYFAPRPQPNSLPRVGVKRSKFNFFRTWSCCISKRESLMQQHGRKYFASRPLPPPHPNPRDGVNRSKCNFFRTGSCCISNLRELRLQQHGTKYYACRPPLPPPQPWGSSQLLEIQLFHNMAMLHIKLKRITNTAT